MMGGAIGVESEPGRGSAFWFTARFELRERARIVAEAPAWDNGVASAAQAVRGRVLIAEDNRMNQKVAQLMMRKLGLQPDVVSSGAEALEALEHKSYDLILMDCQMPGMDGFTVTARIRAREAGGRRTPIIAMTAYAMQGDRERCLQAGMDEYVTKPIQIAEVTQVIERALGRR
jgi:CheY-like chemotaxis protein